MWYLLSSLITFKIALLTMKFRMRVVLFDVLYVQELNRGAGQSISHYSFICRPHKSATVLFFFCRTCWIRAEFGWRTSAWWTWIWPRTNCSSCTMPWTTANAPTVEPWGGCLCGFLDESVSTFPCAIILPSRSNSTADPGTPWWQRNPVVSHNDIHVYNALGRERHAYKLTCRSCAGSITEITLYTIRDRYPNCISWDM